VRRQVEPPRFDEDAAQKAQRRRDPRGSATRVEVRSLGEGAARGLTHPHGPGNLGGSGRCGKGDVPGHRQHAVVDERVVERGRADGDVRHAAIRANQPTDRHCAILAIRRRIGQRLAGAEGGLVGTNGRTDTARAEPRQPCCRSLGRRFVVHWHRTSLARGRQRSLASRLRRHLGGSECQRGRPRGARFRATCERSQHASDGGPSKLS
jgi:hypothetical protein